MTLSADEIVQLSKRYTLYDWSAQSKVVPMAIERAEGVYFYGVDGTRYLDFNSQLMGVNIGHGDKRVIDAIAKQGETLPYITPFAAYETRALLGQKLATLWPGEMEKSFFTLGGAEANENAIRIAKAYTGREKVMVRYRAYHGATYLTANLTGDPRRWANENPPMPGVVRVFDPVSRVRSARGLRRAGARPARGADHARGPRHDRGVHPRDGHRDQRHPDPAGRLPPGRARAVHAPRHRVDRRRGDVRVRAHGGVVRGEPLGRRARPHVDREGAHLVLPAARRARDLPLDRAALRRARLLRGAHLQLASAVVCRGARLRSR